MKFDVDVIVSDWLSKYMMTLSCAQKVENERLCLEGKLLEREYST
jgi:hypothetical protein